ncbi:MAG: hypothetical protein DHS20C10_11990 [marine bacterium B5-7]|nr:MAG: hypothetical protein DHS20C10_11990 [marine bacterium B5-7]
MDRASFKRVYWADVRAKVCAVNPVLAAIIDKISPSNKLPLYVAKYPYGSEIVKRGKFQVPIEGGQLVPLGDSRVPQQLKDDLSYNLMSHPVSMLLDKSLEICLASKYQTVSMAVGLLRAGTVIGAGRMLDGNRSYQPAFLWDLTAGARSIFTLPKISNANGFLRLKKEFDISGEKPKNIFDHWTVFKDLANSSEAGVNWHTELLYFSKEWMAKTFDSEWQAFHFYLMENYLKITSYWGAQPVWSLVYSIFQSQLTFKPDAYTFDTVKHLIAIASGSGCAYAPSSDESAAPINFLQDALVDVYRLENYMPIIMEPTVFTQYNNPSPVYYSIQCPNLLDFSPRSSDNVTIVSELFKIMSLLKKCLLTFGSGELNIHETPIFDVTKQVNFLGIHPNNKEYKELASPSILPQRDSNFVFNKYKDNLVFPENAGFFKGAVQIAASEAVKSSGSSET